MWYIIIYLLFFIAQLLYGSWHIMGPVTPRHIMTVLMFVICLSKKSFHKDKYIGLYVIYIFCFFIAGLFSDSVADSLNKIFSTYIVCIVAYYSTIEYLKYDNAINYFIYTLFALGFLNSVVTIGNMYMMPWATQITNALHLMKDSNLLEYVSDRINTDTMDGFAVPGILSNVANGYFMSYMCVLAFFSADKKLHIYNMVLYSIFLVTLYFIQERTALMIGLIFSIYVIYKVINVDGAYSLNKKRLYLSTLVIAALVLIPAGYDYMMSGNSRYVNLGFDYAEDRSNINDRSIDFILNNPLGSITGFYNQYQGYPHNIVFNALIYGGIIGGVILLYIVLLQVKTAIPLILKKIRHYNYELFFFCLVFICYTLNSTTHNQSIVTGDPTIWVFWAVCLTLRRNLHINQ